MALIVQSPTSPVSNANSYQSLVDARALAAEQGFVLPTDDTEAEVALIKARRYVDGYEPQMCGNRATTAQNTSYPRTGVYIRCNLVLSDEFPQELLIAQIVAAEASGKGVDLSGGVDDGRSIASEKVDVIQVSYFDNGKTGSSVTLPEFQSTIQPLLCSSSSGAQFTTYRI
jgi:hypothetical protein